MARNARQLERHSLNYKLARAHAGSNGIGRDRRSILLRMCSRGFFSPWFRGSWCRRRKKLRANARGFSSTIMMYCTVHPLLGLFSGNILGSSSVDADYGRGMFHGGLKNIVRFGLPPGTVASTAVPGQCNITDLCGGWNVPHLTACVHYDCALYCVLYTGAPEGEGGCFNMDIDTTSYYYVYR